MNVASCQFLQHYMKAAIVPVYDWFHRTWNDLQNSLRDAGLWVWSLLSIIVMNADHGPWDGASFWFKTKEGLTSYLTLATNEDALMISLLPQLWEEFGEPLGAKKSDAVIIAKETLER